MRIELPQPSWTNAHRTEDDAHTLTVAAPLPADWVQWQWAAEPGTAMRVEVPAAEPGTLTLTL